MEKIIKGKIVLYLHPLQQGLKHSTTIIRISRGWSSLLTSITTRIETFLNSNPFPYNWRFFTYIHYNKDWNALNWIQVNIGKTVLYLHPLQQGLKQQSLIHSNIICRVLYLHPLQQELKLFWREQRKMQIWVLYLHPLQQGLKPNPYQSW